MKRRVLVLASLALLLVSGGGATPAQAGTLSGGGVNLTWDDTTLYAPKDLDLKSYKFQWANNSGAEIGILKLTLTDKFGDTVGTPDIEGFVKPGATGFFDISFVSPKALTNGLGPYTLTMRVEPFPSGTPVEVTAPFTFLARASVPKTIKCMNAKTLKVKVVSGSTCPNGWKRI